MATRIPLFVSKQPIQRTPIVKPPMRGGNVIVAEAIGGLAETIGAVATDWAKKKAEVEATSEYANKNVLYKQAANNNITVQSADASIDPDDLVPNYRKSMQEVSGGLVWKSKEAQRRFELNRGNIDLAAEQNLSSLGYKRTIANLEAGYKTSRKISIDNGDKAGGLLALKAIESAFTPEQYKAEKIDLMHDIEMKQASKALTLDINADLSGLKNITDKEKTSLTTEAARVKQNQEAIFEKYTGEQQLKNATDLFTRSDTDVISQAELNILLNKKEISEKTAQLLTKPQKIDAATSNEVWNSFNDKIATVGKKYKDRIGLLNEIIKSNKDGKLEFKDAQKLINAITTPQPKSEINDFSMAKQYFKDAKFLDKDEIETLTYLLDEERREKPLRGKEILDRAKEMVDPFRAEKENAWYKIFFDEKVRIQQLRMEREEFEKGIKEQVKVGKKEEITFNPEGTGYDMITADEAKLERKEGHLPSLDPRTGMVLKARKHPTWDLMVKEEEKLGNKIVKKGERYYSVPKIVKEIPAKVGEKMKIGNIIERGGKRWRITEFDTDGEPLVEEVK